MSNVLLQAPINYNLWQLSPRFDSPLQEALAGPPNSSTSMASPRPSSSIALHKQVGLALNHPLSPPSIIGWPCRPSFPLPFVLRFSSPLWACQIECGGLHHFFFFFFFFFFWLFRAITLAYRSSQARGQIGTAATPTQDPSLICNVHHSSWQRRDLYPLSGARDRNPPLQGY